MVRQNGAPVSSVAPRTHATANSVPISSVDPGSGSALHAPDHFFFHGKMHAWPDERNTWARYIINNIRNRQLAPQQNGTASQLQNPVSQT